MGRKAKEYRMFYKNKFVAEGTIKQIAEKIGMSANNLGHIKTNVVKSSVHYEFIEIPDEEEFAFYRGDTFVDIGTKLELMEKYDISMSEWNFALSPTSRKRLSSKSNTWRTIIERIEEDEFC